MQKALLILLLIGASFSPVHVQAQESQKTWDDIARGVVQGEQEAIAHLLNMKKQIEDDDTWTSEVRQHYIAMVQLLSGYYGQEGLFKEQETVLHDAIRLFVSRDSVYNSQEMRRLWSYLTAMLVMMKDYDGVFNFGAHAMSLYEDAADHGIDYSLICMNVSRAYFDKEEILKAKLYVDEALEGMREEKAKDEQAGICYYNALCLRGMIYFKLGQHERSIADFKEVVEHSVPGDLASPYYMALNNLGIAYLASGRASEGIRLLNDVDATTHLLRYYKYQNLALAYMTQGEYPLAAENLEKYNRETLTGTLRVIANFSEVEREAYLSTTCLQLIIENNLVATKAPQAIMEAYDANVIARQLSLYINRYLQQAYRDAPGFQDWQALQQALLAKDLSSDKQDSIRLAIIRLEKQMLRADTTLANRIPIGDWTFDKVTNALQKNEAIVLFCFAPLLKTFDDVEPYYGAFVIRKGDKQPTFIRLGNANEISGLFVNKYNTVDSLSGVYAVENAQKLYQLLWQPLEQRLKKGDHVYYSLAGDLSVLSLAALADRHGTRLKDKYDLVLLSSPTGKDSVTSTLKPTDFIAFGSPAFDLSPSDMAANASKYGQFSGVDISQGLRLRGDNLRGDWQAIPASRQEVETIASLMRGKGIRTTTYLGREASEEAFKSLSGHSPRILHVATHGFTISTQKQHDASPFAQSVSSVSPNNTLMAWSGLVLAGGNATWKGDTIPAGVEDGILTAEEIARLDLSGTDLVVLSACETARGHVDLVDGVWGLQRAFKQAGAKTVLMTLWKVSDDITALFMEQFYKHLLAGKTIRQSVKLSQDHLIAHGASDPFYWAPFVVLD